MARGSDTVAMAGWHSAGYRPIYSGQGSYSLLGRHSPPGSRRGRRSGRIPTPIRIPTPTLAPATGPPFSGTGSPTPRVAGARPIAAVPPYPATPCRDTGYPIIAVPVIPERPLAAAPRTPPPHPPSGPSGVVACRAVRTPELPSTIGPAGRGVHGGPSAARNAPNYPIGRRRRTRAGMHAACVFTRAGTRLISHSCAANPHRILAVHRRIVVAVFDAGFRRRHRAVCQGNS